MTELATILDDSLGLSGPVGARNFYARGAVKVLGVGTNTPAVGPTVGDRYVVGTAPTGAWSTFANRLVRWDGTAWESAEPAIGSLVSLAGELWSWDGTTWATTVPQASKLTESRFYLSANHQVAPGGSVQICPDAPAGFCWVSHGLGIITNDGDGHIREVASGLVHWRFAVAGINVSGVGAGIQTTLAMEAVSDDVVAGFTVVGAFALVPLSVVVPWRVQLTSTTFVQAPFPSAPSGKLVRQAELGFNHPSGITAQTTCTSLWCITDAFQSVSYRIKRAGVVITQSMAFGTGTVNQRNAFPQMWIPALKPNETLELNLLNPLGTGVLIGGLVQYVDDYSP